MSGAININLVPSVQMFSGASVPFPPPVGNNLLNEDGANLLNEDGTELENEN